MLQMLTHMWGEKHIEMFEKCALKSLSWPKNLEALKGLEANWNIFTEDKYHDRIRSIVPSSIKTSIKSIDLLRDYIDPAQSAFIWAIKECLKLDQKLLMAPADLMWGDGSVHNIWEIGKDPHSVVVVPNIRVLPEFLRDTDHPLTNPQMVGLAWKHLHRAWTEAERLHPLQHSFHGGVEWEKLTDNLYSVKHYLPAPFLMHFTQEDLNYFKSVPTFNSLDHSWPGDVLVPRQRQRYVGSSDACILVEPTEADKSIPEVIKERSPHSFWRDMNHNRANGQIRFIMRAEDFGINPVANQEHENNQETKAP